MSLDPAPPDQSHRDSPGSPGVQAPLPWGAEDSRICVMPLAITYERFVDRVAPALLLALGLAAAAATAVIGA